MSGALWLRSLMIIMAAVVAFSPAVAGQAPSAPLPATSHEHGGHDDREEPMAQPAPTIGRHQRGRRPSTSRSVRNSATVINLA